MDFLDLGAFQKSGIIVITGNMNRQYIATIVLTFQKRFYFSSFWSPKMGEKTTLSRLSDFGKKYNFQSKIFRRYIQQINAFQSYFCDQVHYYPGHRCITLKFACIYCGQRHIIVSTPWLQEGAGDFQKFSVRGGVENFWHTGVGLALQGGLQNLGG